MASLRELMQDSAAVRRVINDVNVSHSAAARRIHEICGVVRTPEAVRQLRKSVGWEANETPKDPTAAPLLGSGRITVTGAGGEFTDVTLDTPITDNDFAVVFELFDLDPARYEIVNDTVRCSTWQQSRRLDNGERDVVQLYSYSCQFKVRSEEDSLLDEELEVRRARVQAWTPSSRPQRAPGADAPSTFVINWADWQIGKSEGGGVAATEARVLESFERCAARISELLKIGRNIEGVALVNMGDPVEGCMGNYASQLNTVELTQRQQLLMVMDLFEAGILNFASMFDKCNVIGVLCNHGEWNRLDGRSATSDSDNASGFLLEAAQRVIKHRPDMQHIKWTIPHDEMSVMENLSGVWNAFTHGHKMPATLKAEEAWLSNQAIHLLRTYGNEPRIWTTAHKHHAFLIDQGPWHRIQCSALDGGSKWYTDATGRWSSPGTTTYLAGTHDVRGFSDYAIL